MIILQFSHTAVKQMLNCLTFLLYIILSTLKFHKRSLQIRQIREFIQPQKDAQTSIQQQSNTNLEVDC